MPSISYAILTHNEGEYIENLLSFLTTYKRIEDEIVVVDDFSDDELTKSILTKYKDQITLQYRVFDGDATQKNYLNSLCTKDYILQLDADELVSEEFLNSLPDILDLNNIVDLFIIPRINTIKGLTQEYINKWGWRVNEKGWVNFPDWQMRLYRNCDWVKWEGLLHSKIVGYKTFVNLPEDELFCILHPKQLDRQISQNNLYDKIEQTGRTKYKI
jgi:glycosyltransferase involved in cell wall biosynthesis